MSSLDPRTRLAASHRPDRGLARWLSCWVWIGLAMVLVACGAANDRSSSEARVPSVVGPGVAEVSPGDALGSAPNSEGGPAGAWTPIGPPAPCERRCAEIFDCTVVSQREGASAQGDLAAAAAEAAAVELDCLAACSGQPTDPFAGCAAPDPSSVASCRAYLDCVTAAWPPSSPAEQPAVEPVESGCVLACTALGSCERAIQADIDECSQRCAAVLDAAQQLEIANCAGLGCREMNACMRRFPGS